MENEVGVFVSEDGVNATLHFKDGEYKSFVLVDFSPNTRESQMILSSIPGVSNVSRCLKTGFLAFRAYDNTVFRYISQSEGEVLVSQKFVYQDTLKIILREATAVIISCYNQGFNVDESRIYVVGFQYPRVKVVPSSGPVNDFLLFKEKLLKFYHDINVACQEKWNCDLWDAERDAFVEELKSCNDIRAIENLLNSSFFWTKRMRLNLIAQFNEVVKASKGKGRYFRRLFPSSRVHNWRRTMKSNPKIKNMVLSYRDRVDDDEKIMDFLLFLRTNVSHFSSKAAVAFSDSEEFLVHLESNFFEIMRELYKGVDALIRSSKLVANFESLE